MVGWSSSTVSVVATVSLLTTGDVSVLDTGPHHSVICVQLGSTPAHSFLGLETSVMCSSSRLLTRIVSNKWENAINFLRYKNFY